MRASVVIILCFVVGMAIGYWGDVADIDIDSVTIYILFALIFCVGITIGSDKTVVETITRHKVRILLPALGTVTGSLLGAVVVAPLAGVDTSDSLAIASGFGYYSLSTVLISQYRGVELATIALVSNILRELITIMGAPLMVRYFGPLAPISAGGATTMDSTLPIIAATSGKEYVMISMAHGFMVDLSVPFLVTLFCTI